MTPTHAHPASAILPPLISASDLRKLLDHSPAEQAPLILECSFDLADTQAGERGWAAGRIPGARYVHLDRDLCAPPSPLGPIEGGRHPLPGRETFAERVAAWGLRPDRTVVCYDRQGGPYAARTWWMLRWLGHGLVTVLDGGLAAWQTEGGPLDIEPAAASASEPVAAPYPLSAPGMLTRSASDLLSAPGDFLVVDARAPERFRGEVEPLDRRAGHIPGARNRFFKDNLGADGRFLPAQVLRSAFADGSATPDRVVHQCGSGVTACHNLLAMEIAGLTGSTLYPGSWSEWSADPQRPIAVG